MMMSPGSSCNAAINAADGAVITSSRCSTSRKRSGSAPGDWVIPASCPRTAVGVSGRAMTTWMLSGRRLGQQGASRKWPCGKASPHAIAPRMRLHRCARAATAKRRSATLVKHAEPRTIVHGEEYVREPAMKVFMFHLMPYAYLDMTYTDKYRAAWVVLPNSYFDPKKGHELYNRYLDELELAAELGFDGISVNEHHQKAYGLMPSPVVMAAALARRTKTAKIAILGNAFCLREHPLTLAEEHAMLDCITGGRLISGMVRGIGAEYYSFGSNPAFSHARFQEAHDLVVQSWTRPGPFAFE